MSKVSRPAQRLEIFTGAGRRRAWMAEQKAAIVAESLEDGAPVSQIARRHGLTPQQVFAWRRQARREADEPIEPFAPASSIQLGSTMTTTRVGASIRPDYRPAARTEKGVVSTPLTLRIWIASLSVAPARRCRPGRWCLGGGGRASPRRRSGWVNLAIAAPVCRLGLAAGLVSARRFELGERRAERI